MTEQAVNHENIKKIEKKMEEDTPLTEAEKYMMESRDLIVGNNTNLSGTRDIGDKINEMESKIPLTNLEELRNRQKRYREEALQQRLTGTTEEITERPVTSPPELLSARNQVSQENPFAGGGKKTRKLKKKTSKKKRKRTRRTKPKKKKN